MIRAIFIVGPTAVGKTALAINLSKKIPSILISADSIQVYKSADIISGKDHPKNIKIELVDILPPQTPFNVRDFVDKVQTIINNPKNQLRIPIIVGGTGLYVKSLFSSIETINVKPNKKLRDKYNKFSIEQLQKELKRLDSNRYGQMNESDIQNPRRLIRAIEICMIDHIVEISKSVFNEDEVLIIGLASSDVELRKRIAMRVLARVEEGAKDEAKKLFEDYDNLAPQLKTANGYKQMFEYLRNSSFTPEVKEPPPRGWEEMIEKWITADYQHAKKQMTYFKKLKNINWFDISDKGFEEKISELISLSFPRTWESSVK